MVKIKNKIMNAAHLHLMFTHLPIVGLFIAIMINLYALFNRSNELKKLTLWAYLVISVFAILAYVTGDGAEEIIKNYPGITEDIIEPHENSALLFFIGLLLIGGAALIGLFITRSKELILKKFNLYLLIVAFILSILAFKTGTTGGVIKHVEIKQGCIK